MTNKTKKRFYIFYILCFIIIIAENVWFWNNQILTVNCTAIFVIIMFCFGVFEFFVYSNPVKNFGLGFHIALAILFFLYVTLLYMIGNYYVKNGS